MLLYYSYLALALALVAIFTSILITVLGSHLSASDYHHCTCHPHRSKREYYLFANRNKMSPTVHFVRHAQGYHNLNTANHSMHDPLLTPYGKQQCAHLATTFPYNAKVDMIVASPLKRTIYTALESFGDVIRKNKLIILTLPEVQETSDLPCDTGSAKVELQREFEGQPIDFSLVVDGWNSKTGPWAPDSPAVEARCREARRWLRQRPEKDIVVVTHGGVLHYLTEDWRDMNKFAGTGWANTEFRSYTFDPASGSNASIVETEESHRRRRGTEKPLTEAEDRNLKRNAPRDRSSKFLARSQTTKEARDWIGGYGLS